jgi:hypothetical protein
MSRDRKAGLASDEAIGVDQSAATARLDRTVQTQGTRDGPVLS